MSFTDKLKKHAKLLKFNFGVLGSFIGFNATNLVAFAANSGDEGVTAFNKGAGISGSSDVTGTLTGLFSGFVSPLQSFGAILLVIFAIILGIKMGASAVSSDPRGREGAIVGLFIIILAGVVIIHARDIVGMSSGIKSV